MKLWSRGADRELERRAVCRGAGITAWGGGIAAIVCAALFLASLHRYGVFRFYHPASGRAPAAFSLSGVDLCAGVGIGGGALRVMWWPSAPLPSEQMGWFGGRYEGPTVWWPGGFDRPHHQRAFPLWMIGAGALLPRGLLVIRAWRWSAQGRCRGCGYDLRGTPRLEQNRGRVACPECGGTSRPGAVIADDPDAALWLRMVGWLGRRGAYAATAIGLVYCASMLWYISYYRLDGGPRRDPRAGHGIGISGGVLGIAWWHVGQDGPKPGLWAGTHNGPPRLWFNWRSTPYGYIGIPLWAPVGAALGPWMFLCVWPLVRSRGKRVR